MNADTAVRTVLVCLAPGPVTAELQVRTAPLRPTVRITTGPGTAAACQIANPAEVLLLQGGLAGKVMAQLDPAHEPPTIVVVRSSDPTVVPALLTSLSGLPFTTNDTKEANTLTSREIQILKLICDGASNAQIARHLESDASTVNHQARRIYQKLGAPNRAAAAAIAVRNGWVESANIAGMNR